MDNNNNKNNKNLSNSYLEALNKASSKITKPTRRQFIPNPVPNHFHQETPVYIVSKENFRDVVQRLTGSLDHPPNNNPIPPTPPNNINNIVPVPNHRYTRGASSSSSRLQRNRPPPLFQNNNVVGGGSGSSYSSFLPPLPPVYQASESPVSTYMRNLQNTLAGPSNGSGGGEVVVAKESPTSSYMRVLHNSIYARDLPPPPRVPQPQPQQQQKEQIVNNKNTDDLQMEQGQGNNGDGNATNANSESFPVMADMPLAFGGRVSSPSGQLSPGILLFSPTTGLPLSPLPSPTWKF